VLRPETEHWKVNTVGRDGSRWNESEATDVLYNHLCMDRFVAMDGFIVAKEGRPLKPGEMVLPGDHSATLK
jgi:hypothetical protein